MPDREAAAGEPPGASASLARAVARARRPRLVTAAEGAAVGDTLLVRARNLERWCGLRQVYLKFEGGNPTGTHKDRIAQALVDHARALGRDTITVATCGNFGAALALATAEAGLACEIYVPAAYHSRRLDELRALGALVVRSPGGYEDAVLLSSRRAASAGLYDANPGGPSVRVQLEAYAVIAAEVCRALGDAPATMAAPVSNGTTLAGLHLGFVRLRGAGITTRVPRMVAGSAYRKNPIVRSVHRGTDRCEDLPAGAIRETAVNEPLVNWHAFDGDLALTAVRRSGGWAADAGDRTLRSQASLLRRLEGLDVLPAATAGLHALLAGQARAALTADHHVVLLTGRRR